MEADELLDCARRVEDLAVGVQDENEAVERLTCETYK